MLMTPSLLGSLDEACEQPVQLLPLGLGDLSEKLQGVGVDRLLGPGLRVGFANSGGLVFVADSAEEITAA
jgi:hypothetical protein